MDDRELIDEFIRVKRVKNGIRILAREIHWDGPATPVSTWAVAKELPATASEAEIEDATTRVLEDDGYFQVCDECGERNPLGWMHVGTICQGCAEANHRVVH